MEQEEFEIVVDESNPTEAAAQQPVSPPPSPLPSIPPQTTTTTIITTTTTTTNPPAPFPVQVPVPALPPAPPPLGSLPPVPAFPLPPSGPSSVKSPRLNAVKSPKMNAKANRPHSGIIPPPAPPPGPPPPSKLSAMHLSSPTPSNHSNSPPTTRSQTPSVGHAPTQSIPPPAPPLTAPPPSQPRIITPPPANPGSLSQPARPATSPHRSKARRSGSTVSPSGSPSIPPSDPKELQRLLDRLSIFNSTPVFSLEAGGEAEAEYDALLAQKYLVMANNNNVLNQDRERRDIPPRSMSAQGNYKSLEKLDNGRTRQSRTQTVYYDSGASENISIEKSPSISADEGLSDVSEIEEPEDSLKYQIDPEPEHEIFPPPPPRSVKSGPTHSKSNSTNSRNYSHHQLGNDRNKSKTLVQSNSTLSANSTDGDQLSDKPQPKAAFRALSILEGSNERGIITPVHNDSWPTFIATLRRLHKIPSEVDFEVYLKGSGQILEDSLEFIEKDNTLEIKIIHPSPPIVQDKNGFGFPLSRSVTANSADSVSTTTTSTPYSGRELSIYSSTMPDNNNNTSIYALTINAPDAFLSPFILTAPFVTPNTPTKDIYRMIRAEIPNYPDFKLYYRKIELPQLSRPVGEVVTSAWGGEISLKSEKKKKESKKNPWAIFSQSSTPGLFY